MGISSEFLSVAIAITTSILSAAASYGALRSRQERLERDVESINSDFVSTEVFRAHMTAIEHDLAELKKDVRILLMHVMTKRTFDSKEE